MTKLILPADFSNIQEAAPIIRSVAQYVDAIKIGLEAINFFDDSGNNLGYGLLTLARELRLPVMWDAKFHDVGNTMEAAVRNISKQRGIHFCTIHSPSSDEALRKVAQISQGLDITALAVTALTDLDDKECYDRFGKNSRDAVLNLSYLAAQQGIKGFVCSPLEIETIKSQHPSAVVVTPGIRPTWAQAKGQKRMMTPGEAKRAGADYIVVGSPITKPPNGMTSLDAIIEIHQELANV